MNRRAFLARSLRLPAAVAALPFVGGLATLAGASEPEAQQAATVIAQHPSVVAFIDGEPVYDGDLVTFIESGWNGAGWYLRSPGQSWDAALSLGAKTGGLLVRDGTVLMRP